MRNHCSSFLTFIAARLGRARTGTSITNSLVKTKNSFLKLALLVIGVAGLLLAPAARAANTPRVFGVSTTNTAAGSAGSVSWPITNSASINNNNALFVGVATGPSTSTEVTTNVWCLSSTGVSNQLTLLVSRTNPSPAAAGSAIVGIYYLLNPPVGSNLVNVGVNGNGGPIVAGAISFTNVGQSASLAIDTTNSGIGTS